MIQFIFPEGIRAVIELIAILIMGYGVFAVFHHRKDQMRGFSTIVIQFSAILLVLPIILILSLEDRLEKQTTATLIGTLAGYLFSELGRRKQLPQKDQSDTNNANKSPKNNAG